MGDFEAPGWYNSGMRMATCHPDRPCKAKGLCQQCYGAAYCASHGEERRAKSKAYYIAHKGEIAARGIIYRASHPRQARMANCHPDRKYYRRGVCRECYEVSHKQEVRARKKEWRKTYRVTHREEMKVRDASLYGRHRERYILQNAIIKLSVLNAYGGARCVCCGETLVNGLTVDHVEGDGAEWRRGHNRAGGNALYRWLRKANYPPGFQVLCGTCNQAKGIRNYCPHRDATPRSSSYYAVSKLATLKAYGGARCACCGETLIQGLTIDHVNGDGAIHRREVIKPGSSALYQWLRNHGYPAGFQVLCFTCNMAKGTGDHCPHQDEARSGPS